MTLVVTPEVLRSTRQAIETALEHATAIANGYLHTLEGLGPAVRSGQAEPAPVNSPVQSHNALPQAITGGTRLAHGLSQAAALMEQHEADSAHTLTSFAANA